MGLEIKEETQLKTMNGIQGNNSREKRGTQEGDRKGVTPPIPYMMQFPGDSVLGPIFYICTLPGSHPFFWFQLPLIICHCFQLSDSSSCSKNEKAQLDGSLGNIVKFGQLHRGIPFNNSLLNSITSPNVDGGIWQ